MENLQFDPMAFVRNLGTMGVGMLGVFMIIAVIIIATYAINAIFSGSKKKKKDSGES